MPAENNWTEKVSKNIHILWWGDPVVKPFDDKNMSVNTQRFPIDLKRSQNDSYCEQNVGSHKKKPNLTMNPWRELRKGDTNMGKNWPNCALDLYQWDIFFISPAI